MTNAFLIGNFYGFNDYLRGYISAVNRRNPPIDKLFYFEQDFMPECCNNENELRTFDTVISHTEQYNHDNMNLQKEVKFTYRFSGSVEKDYAEFRSRHKNKVFHLRCPDNYRDRFTAADYDALAEIKKRYSGYTFLSNCDRVSDTGIPAIHTSKVIRPQEFFEMRLIYDADEVHCGSYGIEHLSGFVRNAACLSGKVLYRHELWT